MTNRTVQALGSWIADDFEIVAEFQNNMPTGLTVSDDKRVFVSFPRWGDEVPFTVAEVIDGRAVPYPNAAINAWAPGLSADNFVSVQSVVVDPDGDLWLLDTGAPSFKPWVDNGPKLIRVDIGTGQISQVLRPTPGALTSTSYLNDIRFDFSRGRAGYAFITDSQSVGALIVVDLESGEWWAQLRGHESTRSSDQFRAIVQGVMREGYDVGADGIAISADGTTLYYCPLSSRKLYSVSIEALIDRTVQADALAGSVADLGDKGASDGLESDAEGNLYATAYEHSAVLKRSAGGVWSTLLHGPNLLWPDTLSLAASGYLYLSANQLPRSPLFNGGTDDRLPPYLIVRTFVGAAPVRLK